MRRLSIALACVVLASQACLAGPPRGQRFDLGRPNTTAEQFEQDRNDCVATIIAGLRRQMHSSRAGRLHLCQNDQWSVSPVALDPPPTEFHGYRGQGTPDNYRPSSDRKYYLADGLFLDCMRLKGYTRVPESTGFRAGPLWR